MRGKHCLSLSLFSFVTDGDLRGRNFLQINNFGYVIAHYSSSIIKSAPLQCKLKLLRLAKYIMLQDEVQFLTLTRMCAYQEQQWQRILSRQSASSWRGSRIRSRASVSEVMTLWKGFQQCFWASTWTDTFVRFEEQCFMYWSITKYIRLDWYIWIILECKNGSYVIGASLSEPHIYEKYSERVCIYIYYIII